MPEFISAEFLKKQYEVFGSFYQLELNNSYKLQCRNSLEILSSAKLKKDTLPEALFIMMNPGKSSPLKTDYTPPLFREKDLLKNKGIEKIMVRAKPDTTQYQVMRLMNFKKWQHVRVINLSDVRQGNSEEFFSIINDARLENSGYIHSIFNPNRSSERDLEFKVRDNAPIVVAWGKDDFLKNLAKLCIAYERLERRVGYAYDNEKLLYYHASPILKEHKLRWLEKMAEML